MDVTTIATRQHPLLWYGACPSLAAWSGLPACTCAQHFVMVMPPGMWWLWYQVCSGYGTRYAPAKHVVVVMLNVSATCCQKPQAAAAIVVNAAVIAGKLVVLVAITPSGCGCGCEFHQHLGGNGSKQVCTLLYILPQLCVSLSLVCHYVIH